MSNMDADTSLSTKMEGAVIDKNTTRKYPKHVLLIIGSEFCERFSYYGMRTVLVLYFRNFLQLNDDDSTSIFHAFTMLAYFSPLFGGIISDSHWGKYKTIVTLSIAYIIGHGLKTVAAIPFIESKPTHIAFSVLGLLVIAFGTGGIKPCVSSFGGDQFHPEQEIYRNQFFSMFYFSINCGALLSKIIMPIIRADVDCYPGHEGRIFEECYALAFGIPGILMIIATVLLVIGSPLYVKKKPTGSIFMRFCKCIISACRNRWKTMPEERNKDHWVDYADASPRMKRDAKYVLAVLMIFSPLPFFWTLFEQQGSRWTLQALQMDRVWGTYLVKPEQMDTVNPFLIITLIPLFEMTLYPLLRRLGIRFTPIRRMAAGLILAALAFVVTALVQFGIDKDLTPLPKPEQFGVRIVNTAPCDISLSSAEPIFDNVKIAPHQVSDTASQFMEIANQRALNISYTSRNNCTYGKTRVEVVPLAGKIIDFVITEDGNRNNQSTLITKQHEDDSSEISFINVGKSELHIVIDNSSAIDIPADTRRKGVKLRLGNHKYSVYRNNNDSESLLFEREIQLQLGGLYSTYFIENGGEYRELLQVEDVNHFSVAVAWMIPQYVILTVGEVFLSITGLEFAYTQAPPSMRSVVTSFWLLTVSLGNVLVIIVAQMKVIERRAHEFLLFSSLTFVAAGIFMYLGRRFTLVDESEFENDDVEEDEVNEAVLEEDETERLVTSSI